MISRSRPDEPFVVLQAGRVDGWKRFSSLVDVVQVSDIHQVVEALQLVEHRVNTEGLCAAGFLAYEAAPAFDAAMQVLPSDQMPLLWFGLYRRCDDVSTPFAHDVKSYDLSEWEPVVTRHEYADAVNRIRTYIAEGDTYQVNYSFRLRSKFSGDYRGLFLDLIESQRSCHGAFIEGDDFVVCSVSPEMFFGMHGEQVVSRPMKGTAKRGRTASEDAMMRQQLQTSEKNRAENLMIVDMIRNDLGRVAHPGSVHVRDMFALERYPTVWQMTSSVVGTSNESLVQIMKALFPCASITGAPKIRSMQIISELESTPRGIYTGCIGYIAPNREAQFNVAIRTLALDKKTNVAEYGVGGGIVWGSNEKDEYAECLSKAKVLTTRMPQFELLETILWTPGEELFLLGYHIDRMKSSAEYFGHAFDEVAVKMELERITKGLQSPHKIRLLVERSGSLHVESIPLEPVHEPVRVQLARSPVDSENVFLYHKTTHRAIYEKARAQCPDDVILWNSKGEITESTIANVVAEIDGKLVTPPVECGLLEGTFRRLLLDDGKIQERRITIQELQSAKSLFLINSVSKWRKAEVVRGS